MDLLSMLTTAQVRDLDGVIMGEVFGVHITGGKLYLTVDVEADYEDPEDDGDGEEIPKDDAGEVVSPGTALAPTDFLAVVGS